MRRYIAAALLGAVSIIPAGASASGGQEPASARTPASTAPATRRPTPVPFRAGDRISYNCYRPTVTTDAFAYPRGATVTFTLSGYASGERVDVRLADQRVTVTVGADGSGAGSLTAPGDRGRHTLSARGDVSRTRASTVLRIRR